MADQNGLDGLGRLSSTVEAALRASPAQATAADLGRDILTRHPEYLSQRAGKVRLAAVPTARRQDRRDWIAQVRALFDESAAPLLHGRLALVGLAELDQDVRAALDSDGLYAALVAELKEPLEGLWTRPRRGEPTTWARLSPSSKAALAYARALSDRPEVHAEHLVLGLYAKADGPTRRFLDEREISQAKLGAALARATEGAAPTEPVQPAPLDELPRVSGHVRDALGFAAEAADLERSASIRSRHLLHGVLTVTDCGVTRELAREGITAERFQSWLRSPVVGPDAVAGVNADTVPEPGDGRVRAADRLGTRADVDMLAPVLLARDSPMPIAVGLLGNWGTGKSFFMALLRERIDELTKEGSLFCAQVRQIHFNAWHYVDGDLWASLATTIFDELARTGGDAEVARTLTALDKARKAAEAATAERQRLERETGTLEEALTGGSGTAAAAAIAELESNTELRNAVATAVGVPGAQERTDVLVEALTQVGTLHGAVRELWRQVAGQSWRRTFAVVVGTVGIVAVVGLGAWFGVGAGVLSALGAAATALAPGLVVTARVFQNVKAARDEALQKKQSELTEATRREQAALQSVADHEQSIDEFRSRGRRFHDFVRTRAGSDDYRARLGTISLLRRDFEHLTGLIGGEPVHVDRAPALAEAVERVQGVERIVLYIDDLDRCPPRTVVAVLQAVHLLLAFKLFVVVVGVDGRWLEKSLRTHYRGLLDDPDDYLEKIFQIPFRLRPMQRQGFRDLIDQLVPIARDTPGPKDRPAPENGSLQVEPTLHDSAENDLHSPAPGPAQAASPRTAPPRERLVLSADERELLGELDSLVTTPRAATRLVNIYRMLRVSLPEREAASFATWGDWGPHAVLLLLGVLIGRPADAAAIFAAIDRADADENVWNVVDGYPGLLGQVTPLRTRVPDLTAGRCSRWTARVARFSFRLAGAGTDHRFDDSDPERIGGAAVTASRSQSG